MKAVIMPRYDPEMKTGRVAEWLKQEGDKVTKGEPVLRIDTEKVSIEIDSPETGIISKILVYPPQEVPIGTPLAEILLEGESAPEEGTTQAKFTSRIAEPAHQAQTRVAQRSQVDQITDLELKRAPASPAARKTARELRVDITLVKGTRPHGRITSEDVSAFVARLMSQSAQLSETSKEEIRAEEVGRTVVHETPILSAAEQPVVFEGQLVKKQFSAMRSATADEMTRSWKETPQVPLIAEVSLSEVEKFRPGMEKLIGKRVSFTAIVTSALANALRSFPDLNSRFENNEILEYQNVDVSIAVALDGGLITPVVRGANRKTVADISEEIEDLVARARSGKLIASDVKGGTTTVSGLSGFVADIFIPMINPPQVTIVGVGKSKLNHAGLPCCSLTLTFDHRATDGARAAQLLQKIKDYIESPYLLQMA